MNRKDRRAAAAKLEWFRVMPKCDYDEMAASSPDPLRLMVAAFRSMVGSDFQDDRTMFNAVIALIRTGLIEVFIAFDDRGVHIRHELLPPEGAAMCRFLQDNDNPPPAGEA